MRASRGEIKIEEILRQAELPFKMEYIFPDNQLFPCKLTNY